MKTTLFKLAAGGGLLILTLFGAALLSAPPATRPPVPVWPNLGRDSTPDNSPPQFVLLSFDGSYSLPMWEESRNFAKQMAAAGKPLHFTYFVSATYFLSQANRERYKPPAAPAGTSLIGFADSDQDVARRIAEMTAAASEGHEIASHASGHWNGAGWSLAEWNQELDSFNQLLSEAGANNSNLRAIGFRAPQLGVNDNLDRALAERRYRYDASRVSVDGNWPKKNAAGIWELPLATIYLPPDYRPTISMDYSIYFLQTGAKDLLVKNSPEWQQARQNVLEAYRNYFYKHYLGNRAPVFIGNHFSHWNDGLYWQVMQDFAQEVCGLPRVRCASYRELVDYLDTTRVPLATIGKSSGK